MTILRLTFSLLYAFAGLSVFFAFIFLKNYPTAILGILTAITNMLLSHLHCLNINNTLYRWYTPNNLYQIGRFGLVIFTFGTMLLVYYSVLEILLKKAILPVSESLVIPIIWALILLKSGLILLYYAKVYGNITEEELLPNVVEESVDSAVVIQNELTDE